MKNILLTLLGAALLLSCAGKKSETNAIENNTTTSLSTVVLNADQMKTTAIATARLEERSLSGLVKASGMLDVPPQNLVTISAPMGGFVKQTEMLQGMKVTKGQVIAEMEHPDYIQLQQDYLEGKSQLDYLELEWQRQEELARENVNAAKSLQQARSNFISMKAKVDGWRARLALININAAELETNGIQSKIKVITPISGYVTQVHVNVGMFVNPNDVMFKIVDTEHLHAEVTIFERDVNKLRAGQLIRLTLSNETQERLASIYLIGKEISEDRTVRVHGHLKKEDASLLPGMFFSALIETDPQTVASLPEAAVVNFEGTDFVFIAENENTFQMVEVKTGLRENGFVEITSPGKLMNELFVTNGAYDLLGMLMNAGDD